MSDDLYALWLTWGTSGHDAQEWAALVMESCPLTEEDQTDESEMASRNHAVVA